MEIIKLDRLKLSGSSNTPDGAKNIIREIKEKTGVQIEWEDGKPPPCRRDACIKLTGDAEAVKSAKEMLLQNMEMQNNRVVLKMDVTHLEHSSLIGRGGRLIKRVMEATGCHIHFPDVNKSSDIVKSNQVSISGQPLNVERSRIMLRALIPVQIFFDVPSSSCFQPVFGSSSPQTKLIEKLFGLLIYSIPRKNGGITVVIRCSQGQFPNYRLGILMLMEFICGKRGSDLPPVHIITDIMPQHQNFVKGNKGYNVQDIIKRTGAKITFPEADAFVIDKSSVKITGNLDCVYMAWQEIMNILPVCLTFDVNETRETKNEYMEFLLDCDISVYTRPKPRFHVKSISVRGPEKFSKQMLQYRQHLLHLPTLNFTADIEEVNLALSFLDSPNEFSHLSVHDICSTIASVLPDNKCCQTLEALTNSSNSSVVENCIIHDQTIAIPFSSVLCSSATLVNSETNDIKGYYNQRKPAIPSSNSSCRVEIKHNSSTPEVYVNSGHNERANQHATSFFLNPTYEIQSSVIKSEIENCSNCICKTKEESVFSDIDYYHKKVLAAKAMRRPIESEESTQVPSNLWAGYGFSQSMPAPIIKDNFEALNQYSFASLESNSSSSSEEINSWQDVLKDYSDDPIWSNRGGNIYSRSNFVDYMRDALISLNYPAKDILPELLWQHGLQKYIDIFTKEEIDYQAFLLLSDEELQMLGIGFQARRKIMWLIRELQDTEFLKTKTFDATPGAGRKSEFFHSYNGL